ncbi:MAG: hypothetical protein ACKPKO_03455, partial [Candidatus Fonsibacter sp.]
MADLEPDAELVMGNLAMDGKSVGPALDKPSKGMLGPLGDIAAQQASMALGVLIGSGTGVVSDSMAALDHECSNNDPCGTEGGILESKYNHELSLCSQATPNSVQQPIGGESMGTGKSSVEG